MNNNTIRDQDESLSVSVSVEPPDFFEFSNEACHINMSHAEDIISCGKLMPYKQPPPFDYNRRYCDSLPDLDPTRSRLTRSSRSLDSKKLRRNSSIVMKSEASDVYRTFSKRSSKPTRWYAFMFGVRKFPPEMDLRDMRSRIQGRMSPAVEPPPVNRTWGHDLLRVLSCKDHQSVGVTAPVRLSCHKFHDSYSRDYHVQKYACTNR